VAPQDITSTRSSSRLLTAAIDSLTSPPAPLAVVRFTARDGVAKTALRLCAVVGLSTDCGTFAGSPTSSFSLFSLQTHRLLFNTERRDDCCQSKYGDYGVSPWPVRRIILGVSGVVDPGTCARVSRVTAGSAFASTSDRQLVTPACVAAACADHTSMHIL
jgi:hypothetical protein